MKRTFNIIFHVQFLVYLQRSNLCKHYLIGSPTASVLSLFATKTFSDKGSNERVKEEGTYIMFKDLLEEYEGMCIWEHYISKTGYNGQSMVHYNI